MATDSDPRLGSRVDVGRNRDSERAKEGQHSTGPSPYSQLLAEQLTEERDRKRSLEQRGLSILSTSGFFVSILFGAVGWARSSRGELDFSLPSAIALGVAIVSLLSAAILGLMSNFVKGYQELSMDALPDLYERLNDPPDEAERRAFRFRSNVLDNARRQNESKARQVTIGLSLQAIAAVAIGFVVLNIAYGG